MLLVGLQPHLAIALLVPMGKMVGLAVAAETTNQEIPTRQELAVLMAEMADLSLSLAGQARELPPENLESLAENCIPAAAVVLHMGLEI